MKTIIDLHTHPSLKPYNNQGYRPDEKLNIWKSVEEKKYHFQKLPWLIRRVVKETARSSQSNLDKLIEGNVRGVFFTIHPVERGWYSLTPRKERRNFRRFLLDLILRKKHYPHLGASMSGLPYDKVNKIINRVNRNAGIKYFEEETFQEYDYIRKQSETISINKKKLRLVSNYSEFKNIVSNNPDTIAGILTIEGGHALCDVASNDLFYKTYEELDSSLKDKIKNSYINNVTRLKGKADDPIASFDKRHTPFFITLCHMFNNYLAGHAKSFTPGKFILPGMDNLLDQEISLNTGINQLGRQVIDLLLSRDNGRRILIDIKHLSVRSRNDYYQIIEERRKNGDQIPIICSHAAVNGFEKNDFYRKDNHRINRKEYFNRWSINLSDEDIRKIHESEGLIGIVPHEGRMPGPAFKKEVKKMKNGSREKQEAYLKLLWSNIFQIIFAVNDKSGWNIIGLGSDYDGLMDPFNVYPTSKEFNRMAVDMTSFLNKTEELILYKGNIRQSVPKHEIKSLMFDYSAEEIVDKLFNQNADSFLKKFFTPNYLEKQKPGKTEVA